MNNFMLLTTPDGSRYQKGGYIVPDSAIPDGQGNWLNPPSGDSGSQGGSINLNSGNSFNDGSGSGFNDGSGNGFNDGSNSGSRGGPMVGNLRGNL